MARVMRGGRGQSAGREIRRRAGARGAVAHLNRWGQAIGAAEVRVVGPDACAPGLDKYVVWRVEWQQVMHLGESVWTNEGGNIPTTGMIGFAPAIGEGHEDQYQDLDEWVAP